jgi:myo-inositol 2-dehydrogenase / D-chiro-inositol 1-dehydrogenase
VVNASPKITIGIIGCGRVAQERHLPALKLIPNIQIVAVADPDPHRVQRLADQYNIPQQYTDYKDLIHDSKVDAVAILTPTGSHAEIGLAAMDANKHLFIEKPLALTLEECDRLANKSKELSAKTIICFNLRWHRLIQQACSLINAGALGKIHAVRSEYTHFRDGSKAPDWHRILDKGGGVTFNESVHHIDLWRFLLQKEVADVFACHHADEFYQDASSMICVRFADNSLGSTYNTFKTSPNSEIEILGEKGRLSVNLYRFDGLDFFPCHQYPGSILTRINRIPNTIKHFGQALAFKKMGGDFQATFCAIWRHFIDCIINDKEPCATLEDGKWATEISLAAIESFKTNKMIHLTD